MHPTASRRCWGHAQAAKLLICCRSRARRGFLWLRTRHGAATEGAAELACSLPAWIISQNHSRKSFPSWEALPGVIGPILCSLFSLPSQPSKQLGLPWLSECYISLSRRRGSGVSWWRTSPRPLSLTHSCRSQSWQCLCISVWAWN